MHIIVDATTTQDEMAFHGIGQYTKFLVLSLLKKYPDLNITVLLFKEKVSTLDEYFPNFTNCEVARVGKYRSNSYLNNLWYFFQFLPIIRKERKKGSIYFCPYFWRNFPAFLLPTVLFVHDMNLARFNMYSQKGKVFNLFRKIQYWKTMYKSYFCKKILCNSNATKRDFIKYLKYPEKKVFVSHLGVDLEEVELDINEMLPSDWREKKYLIYMGGGINKSKNSLGVIKGYFEFLKILQDKKDFSFSSAPYLVISGKAFTNVEKPEVKELISLVEDFGIKEKVLFSGFYEDSQKYSLLKNAFAFIHLALYEGFGISVVEAMRSKTPVIVHESDVYKEVVGDGGIFVDGLREKQVGEVLFKTFIAENIAGEIGQKGYEKSLQYTWEKTADITYGVLKELWED
jgi:glycosyltransferase involved in cell wall biosynthesis